MQFDRSKADPLRGGDEMCYNNDINPPDSVPAARGSDRKTGALACLGHDRCRKAIVYVDGYNLYYGLLKGTPYKWLDLQRFAVSLLAGRYELVGVRYFTAPIKTHPPDLAASDRQRTYLQALSLLPGVVVTQGFYSKSKMRVPYAEPQCEKCDVAKNGLIRVYKMEEKRSDVNLAVAAVADAADSHADCFVFITGDSDQVGAIETIRYRYKKTVAVFNPHEGESLHLKRAATFYQNIPRNLPARCQLPEQIPVGTHGRFLHRPPDWR